MTNDFLNIPYESKSEIGSENLSSNPGCVLHLLCAGGQITSFSSLGRVVQWVRVSS